MENEVDWSQVQPSEVRGRVELPPEFRDRRMGIVGMDVLIDYLRETFAAGPASMIATVVVAQNFRTEAVQQMLNAAATHCVSEHGIDMTGLEIHMYQGWAVFTKAKGGN